MISAENPWGCASLRPRPPMGTSRASDDFLSQDWKVRPGFPIIREEGGAVSVARSSKPVEAD